MLKYCKIPAKKEAEKSMPKRTCSLSEVEGKESDEIKNQTG